LILPLRQIVENAGEVAAVVLKSQSTTSLRSSFRQTTVKKEELEQDVRLAILVTCFLAAVPARATITTINAIDFTVTSPISGVGASFSIFSNVDFGPPFPETRSSLGGGSGPICSALDKGSRADARFRTPACSGAVYRDSAQIATDCRSRLDRNEELDVPSPAE